MVDRLQSEIEHFAEYSLADFSGKDVLVTGASGVIGYYLQSFLTNLPEARKPQSITLVSKSGVFPSSLHRSVKIAQIDLTLESQIKTLGSYDSVFHAAGYGQPGKFLVDPTKTIGLNTWTTELLLNRTTPGGDFIFFSSSEVYSGNPKEIYTESDIGATNTNHPRAAYIEGKRTGETLTHLGTNKGLRTKSLRIALVYGPGAKRDDERVLYSFIRQALSNKRIELKDSGSAMRTYGYVLNAIDQIIAITTAGASGIYNVGGKSRVSILELAEIIASETNSELIVPSDVKSYLQDAPPHVELDLGKTLKLPGQKPLIDIYEGISRTVNWMKGQW